MAMIEATGVKIEAFSGLFFVVMAHSRKSRQGLLELVNKGHYAKYCYIGKR